ncbi:MAG: hypothetical protein HYY18_09970 [Planctomycetes bacterium]|nr:hypothetical protein [Planctomycetota bacterium]
MALLAFAHAAGLLVIGWAESRIPDASFDLPFWVWFLAAFAFAGGGFWFLLTGSGAGPDGGRPAESLRAVLRTRIENLKRQNRSKIADPFWTSSGGHNIAAWSDRGYEEALQVLDRTPAGQGESEEGYAGRLTQALEAAKRRFAADPADEDGGATGAVGDVLELLASL